MAGPGDPAGEPEPDLDLLIGEIRREAARRRAAPDFPVEDEARLALDMDRQGPMGGGVDLPTVLAALHETASAAPATNRSVAEIAGLVESVGRSVAARLADLERRMDRLVPEFPSSSQLPEASTGDGSDQRVTRSQRAAGSQRSALTDAVSLSHWMSVLDEMVRPGEPMEGRVLVAGLDAGAWVDHLSESGIDVYGVDPSLPVYGDEGRVRAGGVAAHLQSVGEDGLLRVLLVGPLATAEVIHLDRWAAALAARTPTVVVLSETLWWWRHRLGPVAADTSPWRPASPETWMAVLHDAGYRVAGRFGPGGRDYCVVGRQQAGGVLSEQ